MYGKDTTRTLTDLAGIGVLVFLISWVTWAGVASYREMAVDAARDSAKDTDAAKAKTPNANTDGAKTTSKENL